MSSTSNNGESDIWRELALQLRTTLSHMGVDMDPCGPGEPYDCGESFGMHCLSYLAAIQARAENHIQHIHHGDPDGVEQANRLLDHWRSVFAEEDDH
ncbi:hypothetical protein FB384_004879 [Prauserella sediminis]|uniref:Uncharacterized protein n=1 Tax=Prauserella sediminis TaxID=577680 RepID=A0A839XRV6_9PSEU|nr:hypothetical protein [Prauserella sediminis]MBB3665920.1 hypothetical protein [Prauserella sediminis]